MVMVINVMVMVIGVMLMLTYHKIVILFLKWFSVSVQLSGSSIAK
jgi:hypothetical protein